MSKIRAADLEVRITADTSDAEAGINRVEGMISGVLVGNQIKDFGTGMLDFAKDFITAGATFEQQMTIVDQIIGGTSSNIDALKQKALDTDINTMFNALEVAQGMEMIARAGFGLNEIIGTPGGNAGLLDGMLAFAAATRTDIPTAANTFSAAMRIFEGSGKTGIEIADLLTAGILRSGKSADQFMTAFQYVGTLGQTFGTTPDELVTMISLMERWGIKSQSAGTGIRSFYTGISENGDDIAALGIELWNIDAAGNKVIKTMPEIIDQFNTLLTGMDPDKALNLLTDIFGKPASSPLYTLFTKGETDWAAMVEDMNGVGSATEMMEARMNTLAGSIEILDASWFTFKKVLGDSISEYVKPVIDGINVLLSVLRNAPTVVHQVIAAVVLLGGAFSVLMGSLVIFNAVGGMGAVTASFAALAPVLLPLLVVVGLLSAAFLAYKTNFGGFGDWVDGVASSVKDFATSFFDLFGVMTRTHGFFEGTVRTVGATIASMLGLNGKAMTDFYDKVKRIGARAQEFSQGFGIIGDSIGRLSDVISKYGLGEGLSQLFTGDIGRDLLKGIGDVFAAIPRTIGQLIEEIEWPWPALESAMNNLGAAFQLSGSVIENVFDGNFEKAGKAFRKMIGRLNDMKPALLELRLDLKYKFLDTVQSVEEWAMNQLFGSGVVDEKAWSPGKRGGAGGGSGNMELDGGLLGIRFGLAGARWDNTSGKTWGEAALEMLAAADAGLSSAMGINSTDENMKQSRESGRETGRKFSDSIKKGFNDFFDGVGDLFDGGGADQFGPGTGKIDGGDGMSFTQKLVDYTKRLLKWEPEPFRNLEVSIIDEYMAWANSFGAGLGAGLRSAVMDALFGPDSKTVVTGPGAGYTTEQGGFWDRFLATVFEAPGDINWEQFVPDFGGMWDAASASISNSLPDWAKVWADQGTMGLIKYLAGSREKFGNGADMETDVAKQFAALQSLQNLFDNPKPSPQDLNGPDYYDKPEKEGTPEAFRGAPLAMAGGGGTLTRTYDVDTKFNSKSMDFGAVTASANQGLGGLPAVGAVAGAGFKKSLDQQLAEAQALTALKTFGMTLQIQNMARNFGVAAGDAAQNLQNNISTGWSNATTITATGIMNIVRITGGLVTAMGNAGRNMMFNFNSGQVNGWILAEAAAAFWSDRVHSAAQVGSLYDSGYASGVSLGSGMVDGILSQLGAVSNAGVQLRNSAKGFNERNDSLGTNTPIQQAQIRQTVIVNIDPKNIQELNDVHKFVTELDGDRQVVFGRT